MKNKSHMTTTDLCDAIVEASLASDLEDVQNAIKILTKDLCEKIADSEKTFFVVSPFTKLPYVTETLSTPIFDDEYYASKYVDSHSMLNLQVQHVKKVNLHSFLQKLDSDGIATVSFCNDSNSVTVPLRPHFLKSDDSSSGCRSLSLYSTMLMQEVRNPSRVYANKNEIVSLLKKNILFEMTRSVVFVPINSIESINNSDDNLVMEIPYGKNLRAATVCTSDGKVFYPIYSNPEEYLKNKVDGLRLIKVPFRDYCGFVMETMKKDSKTIGIVFNSGSINFAMTEPILKSFKEYVDSSK